MLRALLRRLRRFRGLFETEALPETLRSALDDLTSRFVEKGVNHAVIGGVALAMHGINRSTYDLDFLIDRKAIETAETILVDLGFERLHRNDVFGNYLLGPLRVDLLFTKGMHSQRMLAEARTVEIKRGVLTRLVQAEDLIGLKLQALANDPSRLQDVADIHALLRRMGPSMDEPRVRDYFVLFGKEPELDAFLSTHRK